MPVVVELTALVFDQVSLVLGDRRVLDRVSFEIPQGGRLGILGANGSGKTLLARLAAGLAHPTSGNIRIFGKSWDDAAACSDLRRKVGVSLSRSALLSDLTSAENIRAVLGVVRPSAERRARVRVERTLADVGAQDSAEHMIYSQSTGERRRVDLARALVTDPEMLILDDVLEGVDQWGRADLVGRLSRLIQRRRRSLLWLGGDETSMRQLVQTVYRLENGRLFTA